MTNSVNGLFDKTINVRQVADAIKLAHSLNKSIMVFGGAGIGKSEKVAQCANEMFPLTDAEKAAGKFNLVDVRLSDKDPTDLAGVPVPVTMEDGSVRTVFATPSMWPTDPNWKGIIFLDELSNASAPLQQAAYQVVLDHKIGNYTFPKGSVFVAAGNREGDGGSTFELLKPLANRFMIFELQENLDIWLEDYAIPAGVHRTVMGYLKFAPQKFNTSEVDNKGPAFATPRSWVTASDILLQYDNGKIGDQMMRAAIQGTIGNGMDAELADYHKRTHKIPSAEDILTGKVTHFKVNDEEVDLIYVAAQGCLQVLRQNMEDAGKGDDEIVKRVDNYLGFLYNNYHTRQMDIVVGLCIGLFKGQAGSKPLLNQRPGIQGKVINQSEASKAIVHKYSEKFGKIIAEAESK